MFVSAFDIDCLEYTEDDGSPGVTFLDEEGSSCELGRAR